MLSAGDKLTVKNSYQVRQALRDEGLNVEPLGTLIECEARLRKKSRSCESGVFLGLRGFDICDLLGSVLQQGKGYGLREREIRLRILSKRRFNQKRTLHIRRRGCAELVAYVQDGVASQNGFKAC